MLHLPQSLNNFPNDETHDAIEYCTLFKLTLFVMMRSQTSRLSSPMRTRALRFSCVIRESFSTFAHREDSILLNT